MIKKKIMFNLQIYIIIINKKHRIVLLRMEKNEIKWNKFNKILWVRIKFLVIKIPTDITTEFEPKQVQVETGKLVKIPE